MEKTVMLKRTLTESPPEPVPYGPGGFSPLHNPIISLRRQQITAHIQKRHSSRHTYAAANQQAGIKEPQGRQQAVDHHQSGGSVQKRARKGQEKHQQDLSVYSPSDLAVTHTHLPHDLKTVLILIPL